MTEAETKRRLMESLINYHIYKYRMRDNQRRLLMEVGAADHVLAVYESHAKKHLTWAGTLREFLVNNNEEGKNETNEGR